MQLKLLDLLACPKCEGTLSCLSEETDTHGDILTGTLACQNCDNAFPVRDSIPRFVDSDNYSASFGFQWDLYKFEQIDGANGAGSSHQRFRSETGWTDRWLEGKSVLDVGCGAGRFLDVASRSGCEVVGIDISRAVDAAATTMRGRRNVHLIQASVYELPFKPAVFDACYSIGVMQHTPDPSAAIRGLPHFLKKGGEIALTLYERKPWTLLNAKYIVRPITKRLNNNVLLSAIKILMPVFYPVTSVLYRIPIAGRLFKFIIPVAHYSHPPGSTLKQRFRCVTMDTFDMLSPQYDFPQTSAEVRTAMTSSGIEEIRQSNSSGVNLVGKKN